MNSVIRRIGRSFFSGHVYYFKCQWICYSFPDNRQIPNNLKKLRAKLQKGVDVPFQSFCKPYFE